jgi:hypothetical protein
VLRVRKELPQSGSYAPVFGLAGCGFFYRRLALRFPLIALSSIRLPLRRYRGSWTALAAHELASPLLRESGRLADIGGRRDSLGRALLAVPSGLSPVFRLFGLSREPLFFFPHALLA